jgi:hypothetical protein
MKPVPLIAAGIAIAIVSGTVGFQLGKTRNTDTSSTVVSQNGATPSASRGPANRTEEPPLTRTDLQKLRADLDRETDPLARFKLALQHLESWVNADPKGALEWLKSQQPSGRRDEVMRMALAQFSENDPKGASEWAMENLSGVALNNALIRICEQWAQHDGLAAATWLQALAPGKERDAAMEGMFFTWATQDPSGALAFIEKNPVSPEIAAILRFAAFAGWAKSDPQAAVPASLASSKANGDPSQFANTLANWATMDLAGSSQWLLENVKSGPERELAVIELAGIFAHQSPEAGLAWIAKLNAGEERKAATRQFASEWATSDAPSAAKWAANQTPENVDDGTLTDIFHGFLASDPKAFEAWRTSLPEGRVKAQASKVGTVPEGEDP